MRVPDEVRAWRGAERALLAAEVPELRRATVGFYRPFRGEIDLTGLARGLVEGGARAALPVAVGRGRPLEFRRREPGAAMRPGLWDVPVPAAAEPVEPDCLLVPLVGFDGRATGSATAAATTTARSPRCGAGRSRSASATRSSAWRPSAPGRSTGRWMRSSPRAGSAGTAGTCPAPSARRWPRPRRTRTSSRSGAARRPASCTSSERPPPSRLDPGNLSGVPSSLGAAAGSPRASRAGRCSAASSGTSGPFGASSTRASGRSAAGAATSPTPR